MPDYDDRNKKEEFDLAMAFIDKYEPDVNRLMKYVPYFEQKSGRDVAHDYDGEQGQTTMKFPVYDGTLMNFIREAQKTCLMDRNYPYAYSRNHVRTRSQELMLIDKATIRDDAYLRGVISKYVMEGMRKTGMWQDAVEDQIFLKVILRFKQIICYYKSIREE